MKPISFVFAHDIIFAGVKQESSLLAERRFKDTGETLFDELVFDEEYLIKFRELFFDAQVEVTAVLSAYMREVPTDAEVFEEKDFFENRDYAFVLMMPDSFNSHITRPLNIKIREYLIAYIMYRWLETKLPQEAAIYQSRAMAVLDKVQELSNIQDRPIRRWHGYW